MTGTSSDVRTGGFGVIASDAHGRPWKFIVRRDAVTAGGFDHLRIGQRIRFDQEPLPSDPSCYHGVRVSPLDEATVPP
jgi:cold shock CspA family protein